MKKQKRPARPSRRLPELTHLWTPRPMAPCGRKIRVGKRGSAADFASSSLRFVDCAVCVEIAEGVLAQNQVRGRQRAKGGR